MSPRLPPLAVCTELLSASPRLVATQVQTYFNRCRPVSVSTLHLMIRVVAVAIFLDRMDPTFISFAQCSRHLISNVFLSLPSVPVSAVYLTIRAVAVATFLDRIDSTFICLAQTSRHAFSNVFLSLSSCISVAVATFLDRMDFYQFRPV